MSSHPSTPTWHKSSYSGTQENCVEIARADRAVLLRDSKHPASEPIGLRSSIFRALTAALDTSM